LDKTLIRDLRRAFDGIDTKHTGRINFEHLEQLFIQAGERVESARLRELVRFFSSTYEEAEKGITFDDFCDGIAKRDVLLKHPLGKKLAQITLLEHVLRSQELSRCMDRGIVVRGERQLIVDKIVFDTSTKFTLVSTKQDTHGIDCVYTFRFCGGGHQSSVSPSASSRRGSADGAEVVSPSKQVASSLFDVVLNPTSHGGYFSVSMRRISGPTTDYHEAVTTLADLLSEERLQAVMDSCPNGESELV
jgi:hypothetical protein